MSNSNTPRLPILFSELQYVRDELQYVRDELVTITMRMEKLLRTKDHDAMRGEVKKLRELVK